MTMTTPTLLTLLRIALIPVLVLFFYLPMWWSNIACVGVFVFAAVTDWADGFIASHDLDDFDDLITLELAREQDFYYVVLLGVYDTFAEALGWSGAKVATRSRPSSSVYAAQMARPKLCRAYSVRISGSFNTLNLFCGAAMNSDNTLSSIAFTRSEGGLYWLRRARIKALVS